MNSERVAMKEEMEKKKPHIEGEYGYPPVKVPDEVEMRNTRRDQQAFLKSQFDE
jgi:hypothetical protein